MFICMKGKRITRPFKLLSICWDKTMARPGNIHETRLLDTLNGKMGSLHHDSLTITFGIASNTPADGRPVAPEGIVCEERDNHY